MKVVADGGRGGHTRTAGATAVALVGQGHIVRLLTTEEAALALAPLECDLSTVPRTNGNGLNVRLVREIRRHTLDFGPDVIHTYSGNGLLESCLVARQRNCGLVWTICGGLPPRRGTFPWVPNIVSLSDEIAVALRRSAPAQTHIAVLPARMDIAAVLASAERWRTYGRERFLREVGLCPDQPVLLRVARIHSKNYIRSVLEGARVAESLNTAGIGAQFLHVGFTQDAHGRASMGRAFEQINRNIGKCIAVSTEFGADDASGLSTYADCVIGTGRTAFEAMIVGRPVAVIGSNGFAGVVGIEEVDAIAHYNFSGRNVRKPKSPEESIEQARVAIGRLFLDTGYAADVRVFGHQYAMERLSIRHTVGQLEDIYDRAERDSHVSFSDLLSVVALRGIRGIVRLLRRNGRVIGHFE